MFDAIQAIARSEYTKFTKFLTSSAAVVPFSISGISLKLKWAYKYILGGCSF